MDTKKLLSLIIVSLCGFFRNADAQNPDWKWVKWSDGTQTTVRSIVADASGNIYATGTFQLQTKFDTTTVKVTYNAAFVVKYDKDGVRKWVTTIKNTGYAATDCKSMAIDESGNLYITGAYKGTIESGSKTLTSAGDAHYLAKIDNNGVAQWIINTSGSRAVAANTSGVYVAGGKIIEKFDAAGTTGWKVTGVAKNGGYTDFYSIAINKTGNLVLAGDIDGEYTFGTKVAPAGFQDIILMEMNTDGTVNWAKTFGDKSNGGDHAQYLTTDASDNIILTGKIGSATKFDAVNLASKNGYLVKFNSAGVAQWGTLMTATASIYGEGGMSLAVNKDGDVYVTGGCGGAALTDGGSKTYLKSLTGLNAFILKFSSSGEFKSVLTNKEQTTGGNSRGMALAASAAGVYFGGVCAPSSEWGTLKVTGYGSVFSKIEDGTTQGGIKNSKITEIISVYPNPSRGIFNLNLKNINEGNISIVNTLGEIVYQSEVNNQSSVLDLSNYPKGIYFLQLKTRDSLITAKLATE